MASRTSTDPAAPDAAAATPTQPTPDPQPQPQPQLKSKIEQVDLVVNTAYPIDHFAVTVGEGDAVTYALTRAGDGVLVPAEHVQAVRDVAAANHVKLRTAKAPSAA